MGEEMGGRGEGGVFVVVDFGVILGGAVGLLILEDDDFVNAEDC